MTIMSMKMIKNLLLGIILGMGASYLAIESYQARVEYYKNQYSTTQTGKPFSPYKATPSDGSELTSVPITSDDVVMWCKGSRECEELSEALVYEARSESDDGMRLVASTIINRAEDNSGYFPDTVVGVINQPYQYSYKMDKHKQKTPTKSDWRRAREIAWESLNTGVANPDVLYYHTTYIKTPYWAKEMEVLGVVGNHIFYTGE